MLTKTVILIIMVFVSGQPATVTEHQFSSMEACIAARDEAMNVEFRFSREIKAFCVDK